MGRAVVFQHPARAATGAAAVLAALALAAAATAGCSGDDDDCGPGVAPVDGLTVTVGAAVARFGGFHASDAQDCGLDSLTIDGVQTDPAANFHVTFCVPAPGALGGEPVPFSDARVQVINVSVSLAGCTLAIDRDRAATATFAVTGLCGGGLDPAGFAIELAGDVPAVQTCPGEPDPIETDVAMTLAGSVAVSPP